MCVHIYVTFAVHGPLLRHACGRVYGTVHLHGEYSGNDSGASIGPHGAYVVYEGEHDTSSSLSRVCPLMFVVEITTQCSVPLIKI